MDWPLSTESKNKLSLIFSALKMAIATFSSRILGLVREQVMAAYFGASGVTDAFNIAYRVPNMLRDLFAEGAFSSAFVPIFTEARFKNEADAKKLLWSLFILLGSITGIISVLIMVFAEPIIFLVTDNQFTDNAERLELTIQLVRIMAPFLTLISLAALFMGALNSLKIFFMPSLAPAFFNVVMILSMLLLPSHLEEQGFHPIFSLAIGVIAGGLAQMLIQVPFIFKKHYGPTKPDSLINHYTKRIINRLGIGTVGIAATQINILITTALATGTQLGAVSWLNYAFRLFQFPVGILSVSIAGSNLVHFSDAWKAGKKEEAITTLRASYIFSWFSIVPAFCLLLALSDETVNLIFQRGAFDASDSSMTALALEYYLIGLPFYGLYKIFAPTFFTLDKPKVPVAISATCVGFNIIFCLIFVPKYGFKILALGTSLSMLMNCTLQIIFLRKDLDLGLGFFFDLRIMKYLLAGLACYWSAELLSQKFYQVSLGLFDKITFYAMCAGVGALIYLLLLLVMGEGSALKKALKRS